MLLYKQDQGRAKIHQTREIGLQKICVCSGQGVPEVPSINLGLHHC